MGELDNNERDKYKQDIFISQKLEDFDIKISVTIEKMKNSINLHY